MMMKRHSPLWGPMKKMNQTFPLSVNVMIVFLNDDEEEEDVDVDAPTTGRQYIY
jgi:hypothetical protein